MAWYDWLMGVGRIGRRRSEPARDTALYPRLMNIGGGNYVRDRPMIKPTPANLRRFSRTTYARRALKSVKDPIASLDWEVAAKEDVENNPEIERQIEVTTDCFRAPNKDDSFSTLVEQVAEDILVGGAGAIEHQIGGDPMRPLWMWPVDALSIQIFAGWDGNNGSPRYWQALGYGNIGGQQGRPVRNDELVFIRLDPSTETPFGTGAIEIAFQAINRLISAQEYAGNVAGNAHPENLLFFAGLSKEELDSLRAYWRNEVEAQGQVPIFGGGVGGKDAGNGQVLKLRGADDKSLFLGFHEACIREIFAAVGTSPQNAGIEKDVNRNTAEVAEDRDWRMTITPLANRIARHLNREVIEAKLGFSQIEFKWVGLDRADEQAAATIYDLRYKGNAITPNEERSRLNMPPSTNPFADLTFADTQIAMAAARSAAVVDDDELPGQSNAPTPAAKPKPKDAQK